MTTFAQTVEDPLNKGEDYKMTTQEAINNVAEAIKYLAKEINRATIEMIKLNERIEDATTGSRRGQSEQQNMDIGGGSR